MRVIGYIRVSTIDQATEGVSLAAQRDRIAGWARLHEAELADADLFTDAGISGKRADNRPGLAAALDTVCRCGGALVVYSLSRLARSTADAMAIADRLKGAGADLVSLSEDLNTTTASGKLIFRILAVLAEFERDIIAERTRTALALKRSRGERTGQIPYGMSLGADGRSLTAAPAEAVAMDDVLRWHAAGWSLRTIALALDDRKVPTKNGGPRWSPSSVRHLVRRGSAAPGSAPR